MLPFLAAGRRGTFPRAVQTYAFLDLFAGCGGMTRGLIDTRRFRPILAVESDPDAAETYGENFGHEHVVCSRIEDVAEFPGVDVVVGGPPCQGFSQLNRTKKTVTSRRLWREYSRALSIAKPRVFLMENVPGLLSSPEYAAFKQEAEGHGYLVEETVLNVADYGVPQRRKRAIVIGTTFHAVPWAEPTHGKEPGPGSNLQPWTTFEEAVRGLSLVPDGRAWHRPRNPRPETIRRYQAVPEDGGNRFEMERNLDANGLGDLVPPCWRKHRRGSSDVFGRLWWRRPATTIRTEFFKPEKGRYLHPFEDRAITVREAARLMSFSDDFMLPEHQSMTTIGRQIGNAVPPLLVRSLALAVVEALDAGADQQALLAA